ncbi:hypothetical protein B0H11DRAFT_1193264 [Mycena galericulata]|nr:hypothetical protein B0H11DRAFT_1193264 [Mycena galericulata]
MAGLVPGAVLLKVIYSATANSNLERRSMTAAATQERRKAGHIEAVAFEDLRACSLSLLCPAPAPESIDLEGQEMTFGSSPNVSHLRSGISVDLGRVWPPCFLGHPESLLSSLL